MKTIILTLLFSCLIFAQTNGKKQSSQNPSPMGEHTRKHERITQTNFKGIDFSIDNFFKKSVYVFIPEKSMDKNKFDLLIHFHGSGAPVKYAAEKYNGNLIAASISLGSGSSVYYRAFSDSTIFQTLVDFIRNVASTKIGHPIKLNKIIVSGFSAGYGAVKKILSFNHNLKIIAAVLLLDGLHASYVPEGKVLYEGGKIDSSAYTSFINFAKKALTKNSNKKFLFTHSEIFPGTYVSTTESADFLISLFNLKNKPVLKWGPLGMQELSVARKNHFCILGFAGNTAPDHIDQFEGLYYFLNKLMEL